VVQARLSALGLALAACAPPAPGALDLEQARRVEERLLDRLDGWVRSGELERADGFVYAIDLAQALIVAARGERRELAGELVRIARAELVLDDAAQPFTRGFVLWRFDPLNPPSAAGANARDASGTTEALRLAQGLVAAQEDELARLVLAGYARHAGIDRGQWLVRNYFKLATQSFATNCFLIDLAPDLVAEAADRWEDAELARIARESVALVRRARAPCGLLYELVQPEVGTLLDEGLAVFSPNDVVRLASSATVAAESARTLPDVGRRLLSFAMQREPALAAHYLGRTGQPWGGAPAGADAWAALLVLAARLDDPRAVAQFLPRVVAASWAAAGVERLNAWLATELARALQEARSACTPGPGRSPGSR
jgi:hypothetical protein